MRLIKKLKQSCKQRLITEGISDIIVVKWSTGQYKSTPFLVCFGKSGGDSYVDVEVNGIRVTGCQFHADQRGYVDPLIPGQKVFEAMNLGYGWNSASFTSKRNSRILHCQIYLYHPYQKLIISDVDGTLTKSDLKGLVHNVFDKNHIHNGYIQLIEKANRNGYKVVWLTMRSFNLYSFSKRYINMHTNILGPLFTEPEQFFSAVKKQIKKDTVDTKLNMLSKIRDLFPKNFNPFAGGLGNRENDAIAYTAAQIPNQQIFLVNTSSVVQRWRDNKSISYQHMHRHIQVFFPLLKSLIQANQQKKLQQKLQKQSKQQDENNISKEQKEQGKQSQDQKYIQNLIESQFHRKSIYITKIVQSKDTNDTEQFDIEEYVEMIKEVEQISQSRS